MGLLLRIACANLTTVSWLRSRLNVLQPRPFRSDDAALLASLIDVPMQELATRLPDYGSLHGHAVTRYFGAISLARLHQRFSRPQVCPECLHASGICRAAWDFSCYTICEEHMTPMVDRCASCRRRLTWNRPAVDVCVCGAYIRAVGRPPASKSSSSVVSRRIAATLRNAVSPSSEDSEDAADLPEWWSDLSLDGCMRIVTAMGAIERPLTAIKVASFQHASSDVWQGVVERGLDRLRWATKQQGDELRQLAPVIWEGALESIALDHVALPDRQVADRLAEGVLGQKFSGRFGSLRGQLSQRSLF
jgi:hypothetical protein